MSGTNESRSGRDGDGGVCRGQIVWWEGEKYRVLRRRAVDPLAMLQTCRHELFLTALDGGNDPEWVPENEISVAGD